MNPLPSPQISLSCALLAWFAGLFLQTATEAETLRYRAVRGSSFQLPPESPRGAAGPYRVEGTFVMTPQIGPLDWDLFRLSDLRLEVLTGEASPPILRGVGTFGRSARFNRLRMQLDVHFEQTSLHLDSGDLPADQWGPDLEFELKGTAASGATAGTYVLRLAAVPELARWHYRLIDVSTLTDDCGPCGRPTVQVTLRGDFDLVLVEENPLFSRYHLFDLRFFGGTDYELTGEGEYQVGGEVALRQELQLDLDAKGTFGGPRAVVLKSTPGPPTRRWPMWAVEARETEGTTLSTLILELRAAPTRELWFSTGSGMTPGNQPGLEPRISGGDVLTDTGRRVKTNAELVAALGWETVKDPLLIDAMTIAPGGEVWFSFSEAQVSPKLGTISDGDLVSDHGRIVKRNGELIGPFGLMPPAPDVGLDGLQVLDDGEILFSIVREAFSEGLGVVLHPGDILSSKGAVRHSTKDLLAAFQPEAQASEPGLDAFFVWPSGEVWFSTEDGFVSKTVGSIMNGDLLSDQGYVVSRNLDLVQAFQPIEDLANFGLDGLFVVTDVSPPPAPARLALAVENGPNGAVHLSWPGQGRVFQLEQTSNLGDPFAAISPIIPALEWLDRLPVPTLARSLYRLRQW